MVTLGEIFRETAEILQKNGIENAQFEASCLLKMAHGTDRLQILTEPDRTFDPKDEDYYRRAWELRELVRRRVSGEPLQYILGEWEFYGLPFKVGEGVLIPRQDTETLVDLAAEHLKSGMLCADLCAGSGCIGISLAKTVGCKFISYELSEKAFPYLQQNIDLNGVKDLVTPVMGDVLSDETVDSATEFSAIVTNPPYLTGKDMTELQPEVMREPTMALFGGDDGLDYYRVILSKWTKRLKSGGLFAAEIGCGQENDVIRIFKENGIEAEAVKDCCGIYRVVYGIKR